MSNEVQIRFTNPNRPVFARNIMYASALGHKMIQKDKYKGLTAVIVGSGPSLNDPEVEDALRELHERSDVVILACKAAIKWMDDHGMTPDYGVSIDPGAHIACDEKISKVPGVTHIMASVSAPEVFDYLESEQVQIFHSVCGLPTEMDLYNVLFDDATVMQGGFNVVNRALAVAQYMGFESFVMAGCDSGWREEQDIYADGRGFFKDQKKVFMNDGGLIDGSDWHSTPDMVASAVSLAQIAKMFDEHGDSDKMIFLGDCLPQALRGKTDEFLKDVASTQADQQEEAA